MVCRGFVVVVLDILWLLIQVFFMVCYCWSFLLYQGWVLESSLLFWSNHVVPQTTLSYGEELVFSNVIVAVGSVVSV